MNNHQILGVSYTATKEEIKKAFHRLCHIYHPDKPGGNEKKFKEINSAYSELMKSNNFNYPNRNKVSDSMDDLIREMKRYTYEKPLNIRKVFRNGQWHFDINN